MTEFYVHVDRVHTSMAVITDRNNRLHPGRGKRKARVQDRGHQVSLEALEDIRLLLDAR